MAGAVAMWEALKALGVAPFSILYDLYMASIQVTFRIFLKVTRGEMGMWLISLLRRRGGGGGEKGEKKGVG